MNRSLLRDYGDSLRHPEFWSYSTWLELVTRYRRSRLGLFWACLPPALYAFGVGGLFARIQGQNPLDFIAHLAVGYIVFRLVTVSISEATTACIAHASFILDGRVRLTDYVLRVMAKALFYFFLGLPVLVAALAISSGFRWGALLTLIPALLLVLLNIAWIGAIVAVIGARLTDVHELIGSVIMISFLFTPIVWRADQVPLGTLLGTIARANPLFHLLEIVRAPLLGEPVEQLTYIYLAVMLVGGGLLAAWVYRRFARFVPLWV